MGKIFLRRGGKGGRLSSPLHFFPLFATMRKTEGGDAVTVHEEKAAARAMADRIEGKKVELHAKAGSSGKLFGSVTSKEVAEELGRMLGAKIDKKKLTVADIKNFGEYTATIKLFTEISATFTVVVSPAK